MQPMMPSDLSHEDHSKIHDFLDSHPVGVLATVDADGKPSASTIFFDVDAALNITFTTKRDTHKHENISHHNSVMLVAYDSESQSAVQIGGVAQEETDPDTIQKIYRGTLKAAKQTGEDVVPPIAKIAAGPYVAYSIKPDSVLLLEFGWGNNFANAMERANEAAGLDDPA